MFTSTAGQFFNHPWAIMPETYAAIREVLTLRMRGASLTPEQVKERIDAPSWSSHAAVGGGSARGGLVAVIPLVGPIFPRANMMTDTSGGVSLDRWMREFRTLVADQDVRAIVIDVDSPGGSVAGVPEAAAEIFAARSVKPVIAVANTLMASAAYWIASAATEIIASSSAMVGSIGVFAEHVDVSEMERMEGVKTTLISAGKFKVEGNPYEPLGDEAKGEIQRRVDAIHGDFVKAVARHRGMGLDAVRSDEFGQGRVVDARRAVEIGMADSVGTLGDAIARAANPRTALNRKAVATIGHEGVWATDEQIERLRHDWNGSLILVDSDTYTINGAVQSVPDLGLDLEAERLAHAKSL